MQMFLRVNRKRLQQERHRRSATQKMTKTYYCWTSKQEAQDVVQMFLSLREWPEGEWRMEVLLNAV